jgi:hypothetical protein
LRRRRRRRKDASEEVVWSLAEGKTYVIRRVFERILIELCQLRYARNQQIDLPIPAKTRQFAEGLPACGEVLG